MLAFPFFFGPIQNSFKNFGSQPDENLANQFLRCQKLVIKKGWGDCDRQVWKSAKVSMRPFKCEISHSDTNYNSTSKVFLFRHWSHLPICSIQGTNCLSKEKENHFCFGSFILVMMLGCNDPESRDCRSPPSSHSICPKSKRQSGSAALYWKARVTSTDRNFESFSFKSPFLTRPDL